MHDGKIGPSLSLRVIFDRGGGLCRAAQFRFTPKADVTSLIRNWPRCAKNGLLWTDATTYWGEVHQSAVDAPQRRHCSLPTGLNVAPISSPSQLSRDTCSDQVAVLLEDVAIG